MNRKSVRRAVLSEVSGQRIEAPGLPSISVLSRPLPPVLRPRRPATARDGFAPLVDDLTPDDLTPDVIARPARAAKPARPPRPKKSKSWKKR